VNFGTVAVGGSKTKTLTIKLDAGFYVNDLSALGPFTPNFGTCNPGPGQASCKVSITYSPAFLGNDGNAVALIKECPIIGTCETIKVPMQTHTGV
jgi:hypothetical protein